MKASSIWLLALVVLGCGIAAHAAAPRTAVLDFALANSPGSSDLVVNDFSRAVQTQLLASPAYDWVERQELDRITQESDQSGLGRVDPATAVRLGHLARADLLLRGEIAVAAGQGTLTLEVIDLKRADVLATGTVTVTPGADGRVRPTAGTRRSSGCWQKRRTPTRRTRRVRRP